MSDSIADSDSFNITGHSGDEELNRYTCKLLKAHVINGRTSVIAYDLFTLISLKGTNIVDCFL